MLSGLKMNEFGLEEFDTEEDDHVDEDEDLGWWTCIACLGFFCMITSIIGTIQIVQWVYLGIKSLLN